MLVRFTDDIWFGDKPGFDEAKTQAGAVINVAHSIREPYWRSLSGLDWRVWYYRLAVPDREVPPIGYMEAMTSIFATVRAANKFPLFCHCRMGGHRGPTVALFAAWYLDGCGRLDYWISRMIAIKPDFLDKPLRRVYRQCVLDYCKKKEMQNV